ncbi:chemotaxis protein CheR [Candidatus Magnetomorum sp. HK-1]|nr:chemotaxis protein CheR [Candidatus Magnetomorum sp. HK-1]
MQDNIPKKEESVNKSDKKSLSHETSLDEPLHNSNQLIVVGIGASAGGLEALKRLIPGLPNNAGMCFIIAQHLDPKHRSMLVSLLERHTEMPVSEVSDKQQLAPDKVYITPSGKDVAISDEELILTKPLATIGPKPSVDYFFTSLAEEKGDRAVGIILSGTGSDGAHGIRAIKVGGGITIAQSTKTAKYNGMPASAIETGHVDKILSPEDIGPELEMLIHHSHSIPKLSEDIENLLI